MLHLILSGVASIEKFNATFSTTPDPNLFIPPRAAPEGSPVASPYSFHSVTSEYEMLGGFTNYYDYLHGTVAPEIIHQPVEMDDEDEFYGYHLDDALTQEYLPDSSNIVASDKGSSDDEATLLVHQILATHLNELSSGDESTQLVEQSLVATRLLDEPQSLGHLRREGIDSMHVLF